MGDIIPINKIKRARALYKASCEISALSDQLDSECACLNDLWTWLPSYKAAVRSHNEYAIEFLPSVEEVLREACEYISMIIGQLPGEERFPYLREWFGCPCGKDDCTERVLTIEQYNEIIESIRNIKKR